MARKALIRMPRWWGYNQNNSGGSFDIETGHYVLIPAYAARATIK